MLGPRVSFVSKCLLAESAPKERSRFAHGSDSKLVQNGPHGPKALTVRSRFDIQNWSKMVLLVKSAHGSLTVMFKMTIAGLLPSKWWFRGKLWFRGKVAHAPLTLISQNGVRFSQNGGFAEKVAHARSRSAHAMGSVFRKMVQTAGLVKNPAHASLTEWHFENRRKRHSGSAHAVRSLVPW